MALVHVKKKKNLIFQNNEEKPSNCHGLSDSRLDRCSRDTKIWLLTLKYLLKLTDSQGSRLSLQLKTRQELLQQGCEDESDVLVPPQPSTELDPPRGVCRRILLSQGLSDQLASTYWVLHALVRPSLMKLWGSSRENQSWGAAGNQIWCSLQTRTLHLSDYLCLYWVDVDHSAHVNNWFTVELFSVWWTDTSAEVSWAVLGIPVSPVLMLKSPVSHLGYERQARPVAESFPCTA